MSVRPLRYKEDWPRAVERLTAWWHGEVIDRACVQVTCPRPGAGPMPDHLQGRLWLDTERQLDQAEAAAERTAYLGEAFPCYWPNIGPETLAVYLGCPIHFAERTTWTEPLTTPPGQDWPDLRFDPSNRYYQWVRQATAAAMDRLAGKMIVGITDLHDAGDTLAAIRDPQQLCLDLIERPDRVRQAIRFLQDFRNQRFDENVAWTIRQGGTTTWLSGFSTGVYACTQIDFCALISPAMLQRFFREQLNDACRRADHVMYHLDGPGELVHLDVLLALDNLHAIQWVHGAGRGPQTRWLDLLKRLRAAGKSLHLYCEQPAEAVELVEQLGPAGLCLQTQTDSLVEAERLIRDIERASARKRLTR